MQPAQFNLARYRVRLASQTDFAGWRDAARRLALNEVRPEDVAWGVEADFEQADLPSVPEGAQLVVQREFIAHAETAFCHSDPGRFAFLYRMLWRLRTEPKLLAIATDPDTRRLEAMEKAVRRDSHKMHAFVRFRKIGEGNDERYVAWFEPDHFIVERNADFFVRRFTGMRWTILTPYASADWDGERLAIGPGAAKGDAPAEDDTEALWLTYFENIFNPARLKVKAMQKEMPKKYWRNLPEASLIPDLIAGADEAAKPMIARQADNAGAAPRQGTGQALAEA